MGPVYEARPAVARQAGGAETAGRGRPVSASVDHPNIVPVYEAGEWEGGRFAVEPAGARGALAELLDAGSLSPRRFDEVMDAVTDAVAAAHRAGVTHGRPGGPQRDRGPGRDPVRRGLRPRAAGHHRKMTWRRSRRCVRGGRSERAGGQAGDRRRRRGAPAGRCGPPARGRPGRRGHREPVASVGCAPDPDPNTPACTLGQDMLGGRSTRVRRTASCAAGRSAAPPGELSLQVLRGARGAPCAPGSPRCSGCATPAAGVPREPERGAGGPDRGAARAGRPDRPAPARGRPGALWDGQRNPLPRGPTAVDGELLLRADVTPGARAAAPPQLSGARAAAAAPGRVLAEVEVEVPGRASM